MGPEALVIMISLLATAVIFLIILYPQWRGAAEGGAEGSAECSSELLLRSLVKKVSFGYGDVPVNCEVRKRTITQRDIEQFQPLANQATKIYASQNSPLGKKYSDDVAGQRKWAISKIMADELVSCYKKGWQGKISMEQTGLLDFFPPKGALCLYCARISYDEDLTNSKIEVYFSDWLENNIIGGKTYSDYLYSSLDSANVNEFTMADPMFTLEQKQQSARSFIRQPRIITSEPTAVMLIMLRDGNSFATAGSIAELKSGNEFVGPICRKVIGEV